MSVGKYISKILSSTCSQKHLDAKQSSTDGLKTASKTAIQERAEATDLVGNKITDIITNLSKRLPQNNSETVESETENTKFDKKYQKKIYISRTMAANY